MLEVGKEIITLIIHDDEGGEVLNVYLTYSLHAELLEVYDLNALDRVLGEDSCGATDRAEVEAAVSLTSVGHLL